jgi:actin-like ATPase involved in cell morphogenesis
MNSTFPFIGIDFGTSKSSMAWYDPKAGQAKIVRNDEEEEKTASVVYFDKDETLVGTPAERMLEDQEDPEACRRVIVSVKRSLVNSPTLALPGRRVKATEVAAEILSKLKRDAEKGHFYQAVTHAVITCPAAFDLLQRDEIEKAGKLAGFSEVQLLEEPVAAALAYAHEGLDVGNYLLVYDLGGGTFDVAVLAREGDGFRVVMEPKGMARCGGDDFDRALYDYCDEVAQQILGRPISVTGEVDLHFLHRCRERKENLSSRERVTFSSWLRSESGTVQFKQMIERTKIEELIGKYIEETVRLTKDILEESVASGCTVDTVVLIGGSSRVPLVRTLLKETLPVQPKEWQKRDMAVALGAAYYANSLWGMKRAVSPTGAGLGAMADELTAPVQSDGPNADGQLIRCPACGATNRVPQEKIAQGLAPVCGRCRTPLRVQPRSVSWNAQEQYHQAVEMAWADQGLQMEEGRRLVALADQLGLTKEEAADVERAVMGATKEGVLKRGKPLAESSPAPALPLQDFDALDEMLCEDCGKEIPNDATICAHCGSMTVRPRQTAEGGKSAIGRDQHSQWRSRLDETVDKLSVQLRSDLYDNIVVPIVHDWFSSWDSLADLYESIRAKLSQQASLIEQRVTSALGEFESYLKADLHASAIDSPRGGIDLPRIEEQISDRITDIIGVVVTVVSATLAGGAGTALIASGPVGWIIGLLGGAVIYSVGRGAVKVMVETQIRTRRLPPFLKRSAKSKVTTELSSNAGKFETEIHALLREKCDPLYSAIHDINA